MTEERLAEIEARLKAATPGPWYRMGNTVYLYHNREWAEPLPEHFDSMGPFPEGVFEKGAPLIVLPGDMSTGEFIAHTPADVADLIAEVRRLRGRLDEGGSFIWGRGVWNYFPVVDEEAEAERRRQFYADEELSPL